MKKQRDYSLVAIALVFVLAGIPSFGPWAWGKIDKPVEGIKMSNRDERGLTSVKYVQDGKTWALDYLDAKELDSLQKALKCQGCLPPCEFGLCKGNNGYSNGIPIPCICCAKKLNGYCEFHVKRGDTIGISKVN